LESFKGAKIVGRGKKAVALLGGEREFYCVLQRRRLPFEDRKKEKKVSLEAEREEKRGAIDPRRREQEVCVASICL